MNNGAAASDAPTSLCASARMSAAENDRMEEARARVELQARHAKEIEWCGNAHDAVVQAMEDKHGEEIAALNAKAVEEGREAAAKGRGEGDARVAAAAAAHAAEVRSMDERHVADLKRLRARGAAEMASSSADAPSSRLRQSGAGGAAPPPAPLVHTCTRHSTLNTYLHTS